MNLTRRDQLWLRWLQEHGASDDSMREFLKQNPPPDFQPARERSPDMKSALGNMAAKEKEVEQ